MTLLSRWAWPLVLTVTLAVWMPTITYGWLLTWDDGALFAYNPHVRAWDWTWTLTTQYYGHWMPLTWLSAQLNYAAFGFHPASWHAVNVALHAASAVIFYFIARRLCGSVPGALFAALLFAVHPLRMESVAWITERKDVLLGAFFLASILLWMQGRKAWAFAAFVGACLSKSPAVILPVVLLAYDWYRFPAPWLTRRQWWTIALRRLAPFFALSVVVTVVAFHSLRTVLVSMPWADVGLGPRLLHVAYSALFYVQQTVYPARLSGLIEYTWAPSWDQPQYPIALVLVGLAAGLCWLTRARWPALTAAAVVYGVAVLPQSGLFQNGPQLVANRYSYLACLPLALLAGGALTLAARRLPRVSYVGASAILAAFVVVTLVKLPMWTDGDTMWRYAAQHEPTCTQCQDMASAADYRDGDLAAALHKQERAIAVSDTTAFPRYERHYNRALFLLQLGRPRDAEAALRVYLASVPADRRASVSDGAHYERARAVLAQIGHHHEAAR